jgi:plasmid stabilization system protein ParE
MPTFVLSHEAEMDIAVISEYIAKHNVTAAIKMLDLIEQTCQTLAANPGLGEVRKGFGVPNCRSFAVSRYVIFFRPNGNGIDVARILDASRDL